MGRTAPAKRAALVRKIISPLHLGQRMAKDLKKLTNVEEVTILPRNATRWLEEAPPEEDKAASELERLDVALKDKIKDSPQCTFHFVHEIDGRVSHIRTVLRRIK